MYKGKFYFFDLLFQKKNCCFDLGDFLGFLGFESFVILIVISLNSLNVSSDIYTTRFYYSKMIFTSPFDPS